MSDTDSRKKITIIVEDEDSISTTTFFSVDSINGKMEYRDMSVWDPELNDSTHISFQRPTTVDVGIRFTAHYDENTGLIREGQVFPK